MEFGVGSMIIASMVAGILAGVIIVIMPDE